MDSVELSWVQPCAHDTADHAVMGAGTVFGVDLSLTATGLSDGSQAVTLKPPKEAATGLGRMRWIVGTVLATVTSAWLGDGDPPFVVIEGPSYGSTKAASSAHERAGLWWLLVEALDRAGIRYAVASPASLKLYATGKGNADKDAVMLATARRFDWFDGDNNAADALWLAAIGCALVGNPLVAMPAANCRALDKIALTS